VLIVDDHEMLAESLVRLLSDDPGITVVGHEVTATNGIRRAAELVPDIVLMDFELPDMDGASATRMLRRLHPDIKVITVTGTQQRGAYFAAMEAGSSGWVRKTHALQELRLAVHSVHQGNGVLDDELASLPTLDQLRIVYQPVVDLTVGAVVGFEALVRWQHPDRGLLAPEHFLARAEQTGLLSQIDRWMRRQASAQLARWQGSGTAKGHRLWMSVNLSAADFANRGIADAVTEDIRDAGIDPADFVVEVTETVLLADDEITLSHLERIKSAGISLALDDFGTGFSSLSYLRRFPFDILKIDGSFTAELPSSSRTMLLVEAIQHLTSSVGLRGIAEGIERPEQVDALRRIGWQLGQGYLYSRPVDARACEALVEQAAAGSSREGPG
jgi:EAL domain-containing protein (putative c-di-GMP-specific phosphodiesterase class I)